MAKYEVIIKDQTEYLYEVEAESEEDAKHKAYEKYSSDMEKDDYRHSIDSNSWVDEVNKVEEEEEKEDEQCPIDVT